MYVSNNPLKYVDPSGREKSGGYDPVNLYNKNYLFLKPIPKEILELQKQQEEAEKEARKKLVIDGTYNVFKGFMEATSGAMVTISSVVVMPAHPVLGYSGATVGTSYANMGLSNMSEGAQDIFNGITGNVEVPAFNPTRDVFFGGNQEAYNCAEVLFGGANYIFGMGLSNLPLGGPASGNIAEYANAGSQMMDFLDMAEAVTTQSHSDNDVATVEELLEMMNQREGVTARFASGDELAYLISQDAEASHMLLEDGTSDMIFRKDVSTRWTMYHEWLHHYLQKKNGGYMPGEDEFIEDFLERHKEIFKIGH